MRKYFDQKFKTKFSKQTMAGKEGFQWVIREMENEFEYPECDSNNFDEFFSSEAIKILFNSYFIQGQGGVIFLRGSIQSVCD